MKFTMRTKLIAFLASALLISIAMGFIGFLNLLTLKQIVYYNENIVAKPLAYVAETSLSVGMSRALIRELIISETDPDEKLHDKLFVSLDLIQTQLKGYTDTLVHNGAAQGREYDMVINLTLQTKEWAEQLKNAEELISKNKKSEAIEYLQSDVEQNGEAINKSIRELIDLNKEQANNSSQTADSLFDKIAIKMIFIIVVGVFVLALMGLLIIRSIAKAMSRMVAVANRLTRGETSITISDENNDEIGQLEKALSQASQTIYSLINDVENFLAATRRGDYLQRADSTKHKGSYAKIIQGINRNSDIICNHFDNIAVSIAFLNINKKIVYKNKAMINFVEMFELNSEDENILAIIISSNESIDLDTNAKLVFESKNAVAFENTIVMRNPATNQHHIYNLALHYNGGKDADLEDKCVMITISEVIAPAQAKNEADTANFDVQ